MTVHRKFKSYILPFLIFLLFTGCEVGPTGTTNESIENCSLGRYSPYNWSHDGKPYESKWCIVYSDGASLALKEKAGQFCDNKFIEIMKMFDFTQTDDFRLPPENSKIHLYINQNHQESIAAAFWGTIIITVRTADLDTSRYDYLFRHELTHEFEYLIEGTVLLGTDVWFREGIAIYMGGGMNYINDVDDLEKWINDNSEFPNGGNPITIHQWENFPDGADITGYYTVFDVVMEYILGANGLGKSKDDVLDLFYDVRGGTSFPTAFQNRFGISINTLELEIFDRLRGFLPNSKIDIRKRKQKLDIFFYQTERQYNE